MKFGWGMCWELRGQLERRVREDFIKIHCIYTDEIIQRCYLKYLFLSTPKSTDPLSTDTHLYIHLLTIFSSQTRSE